MKDIKQIEATEEQIQESNKRLSEFMEQKPKIMYAVGAEDWVCYTPQHGFPAFQKEECERFLKDRKKEGGMYSDCVVKEFRYYPQYQKSWDELMPVWKKIYDNLNESTCNEQFQDDMTLFKYNLMVVDIHQAYCHLARMVSFVTSNKQ